MNRGHGPRNQCKDPGNVQLPHHVTSGARPQQVIHTTHGEQKYRAKCHDAETRGAKPIPTAPADEKETQDRENEYSQEMREAVYWLPEARDCKYINTVRCRLHVVAEPDPLDGPSSLNDSDQHHGNGDDEQQMDEATERGRSHDSQQSQDHQDNKDRPKHLHYLSIIRSGSWPQHSRPDDSVECSRTLMHILLATSAPHLLRLPGILSAHAVGHCIP